MKEVIIEQQFAGQRLDKFLKRYLSGAGSGFIYKMLRKKNIVLNEKKAAGSELLCVGDSVRLYFSDETFSKLTQKPEADDSLCLHEERIIFEDDNLLLYNKEEGLLTQSDASGEASLCEMLIGYLLKSSNVTEESLSFYRPSAVNRLDRNTTGIVICAKNLAAARELSALIKDRGLAKCYLTVCKGSFKEEKKIEGHILKDKKKNTVSFTESPSGDKVSTVITPVSYDKELDASLVQAELITGKTHQIRASLALTGHPVACDTKYGDADFNKKVQKITGKKHQLLHSYMLKFPELKEGELKYLSGKRFLSLPEFGGLFEDVLESIYKEN